MRTFFGVISMFLLQIVNMLFAQFIEITRQTGVDFQHSSGATGHYHLPETVHLNFFPNLDNFFSGIILNFIFNTHLFF